MKHSAAVLLLVILFGTALADNALADTATLSTHGVTGTINFRLIWDRRLKEVWAYWGGGPNDQFATVTLAAEDYGARGVFALRGGVWVSAPLDARIDAATPAAEEDRLAIRDAVLDVFEEDLPQGHVKVGNARKNGRKKRADDLEIRLLAGSAARTAAIQAKIDELRTEDP